MTGATARLATTAALVLLVTVGLRPFGDHLPYTVLGALAAATAAGLAARAAGRATNRRGRIAWCCQSIGCALWCIAPATWLLRDHVPWLSAADVGRTGFLLFAAIGFWLTSRGPFLRAKIRMLLDGVVGASAALICVWAFVLAPVLAAAPGTNPRIALSLGYPLGALLLVVFYLFLALTEMRRGRRRMPGLFMLGLLGIGVADIRYVLLSIAGTEPARTVDLGGWLFGFAFVAAAAAIYRGTTQRQTVPPVTWWVAYAPYLALVPAGGTMLWQLLAHGAIPTVEYVASAVVVTVIFLRQLVIVQENRTLVQRLVASQQQLRHQATHDSLTGLGNRALLLSRLGEMLTARAGQPAPLALIFCDLDDFKNINDTYGHHAGDQVLVQVAERLRGTLRRHDVVVRLGGDEYAAVLECSAAEAEAAADRLWHSFQEPYQVLDRRLPLHASIGLTHVATGTDIDPDELLREADVAMYAVKRAGKNGVHVFTPDGDRPTVVGAGR